jgi:hypothetical protein
MQEVRRQRETLVSTKFSNSTVSEEKRFPFCPFTREKELERKNI